MPGELNSPYRRDPFTGDFYPKWNEADEVHVATLQESNGLVGFFLFEAPQLRQPSDFICAVLDDEYDETGTPLAENARLDSPDADEFRVDYDAESYLGTGFVEVNASRVGQFFRVGYWGLGTPPRWETHLRATLTVSESFAVAGDLEVGGDLVINDGGDVFSVVGSVISAHENRVRNIANAVDADDAVPLGQAGELVEQHGVERLSGSGTWVRPRGVSKVFLVAIGGGGSGAVNGGGGGGGGGGAAVYGLVDLDAIDPDETDFAYVVGGAGVDTTVFGAVAKAGANGSGTTGGAGGTGSTIPAEMIGREAVGGTGANGSGGTGGGGGAAAGGLGGTGANGSGATGGAATGFFSGSGGNGTLTNGAPGVSFGGGGGGGQTTGGAGANGFIFLIY